MVKQIVPNIYGISLGFVNAFLIDADDLTLIDTGIAGSAKKILQAVSDLGRQPADVRRILLTHCHGDHTGGLAEIKAATGAAVYMHPADAALIRWGQSQRPAQPGPGFFPRLIVPLTRSMSTAIQSVDIEHEVQDGDDIGGLKVIHTPGHTAGHLAFFWPQHGGVLFVGDAASNTFGRLGWGVIYEDLAEGKRNLAKIAALDFEVACFSHGQVIVSGAAARFRQKWGEMG